MEENGLNQLLSENVERLAAAAASLERTSALIEQREAAARGDVTRIVATVEGGQPAERELELERKLQDAERQIAELKAQAGTPVASPRKTLPVATAQLLAKQGITSVDSIEAGALDGALAGLDLEQRIALKAQLIRTGALK